jgi:hypothetical protein
MEEAARAAVVGVRVERRRVALGVAPREERRRRPFVLVERDERMPEAGERERVALPDLRQDGAAGVDQLVGIVRVVGQVRVARLGRPLPVEGDRAHRGRADVERHDSHGAGG